MSPLTRMGDINGVEVNQVTVIVDSSLPEPFLEGIAQVPLNNVSSTIIYDSSSNPRTSDTSWNSPPVTLCVVTLIKCTHEQTLNDWLTHYQMCM